MTHICLLEGRNSSQEFVQFLKTNIRIDHLVNCLMLTLMTRNLTNTQTLLAAV